LTLIIVGFEPPFDFRNFSKTIAAVLIRLAMMLAIAYLINTFIIIPWLGLDKIHQAAVYALFILPPPLIIPLSIIGECDHKRYVWDYISLHLIISLIAFVALINLM
jgi:malate permease and related proteins